MKSRIWPITVANAISPSFAWFDRSEAFCHVDPLLWRGEEKS
jgi:hypothetical protein